MPLLRLGGLALVLAWSSVFGETNINVPTNAPPRQWEFIIIHHSATKTGNADEFDTAHRARGMSNGLAYHFVIDNGTSGMADGNVETGSRWEAQLHGGHCRQAYINEHGIGICLVGDFTKAQPSAKQMDALVALVRDLQTRYKIPDDNVLGHGEVVGEYSECPGKEFPWEEFKKRLKPPPPAPPAPPAVKPPAATAEPPRPKGTD